MIVVAALLALCSCFPPGARDKANEMMHQTMRLVADQQFKQVLGQVELHKLRFGRYPESLGEIKFLSAFDSAAIRAVEYILLDSVYELNYVGNGVTDLNGQTQYVPDITYKDEFWQGLGCSASNFRK